MIKDIIDNDNFVLFQELMASEITYIIELTQHKNNRWLRDFILFSKISLQL